MVTAGNVASRSRSFAACQGVLLGIKDRTVVLWEQRIPDSHGGQSNGLNLPFPGITPVTVSELHQGWVTPGSFSLLLLYPAELKGNATKWFQAFIYPQALLAQRHWFVLLEGPIFDCTVAIRVLLMLFLLTVKCQGCIGVIQFWRGSF